MAQQSGSPAKSAASRIVAAAMGIVAPALALVLTVPLASCGGPAQPVEEAMLADGDNWPSWGRNGHETHYQPARGNRHRQCR